MVSFLIISKHLLYTTKGRGVLFAIGVILFIPLSLNKLINTGYVNNRKVFTKDSGSVTSHEVHPCNQGNGCGNSPKDNERRILIGGDHCIKYHLNGTIFSANGISRILNKEVEMCHLKSFDAVNDDLRKTFLGFDNKYKFSFSSPSFLWVGNKLALTLRLKFYSKVVRGCYSYMCNQIHFGYYDKYLRPIGRPDIITLRTPYIHPGHGQIRMGPVDGRLFQINNALYSLFSTGYRQGFIATIWDFHKQQFFTPRLIKSLLSAKHDAISEKNWVPVIIKDELYIIRYLDPLQVMKCKIHEDCTVVYNNSIPSNYVMDDRTSPLRGGTEFKVYQYPYYISIAHATYVSMEGKRTYEAYLVVLCVDPFRIVYVSDKLQVQQELFRGKKASWPAVVGDFIFPTGLIIEDKDSVVIGAHANDAFSMLLRLKGIQPIVESVIDADKGSTHKNKDFTVQQLLIERANAQQELLHNGNAQQELLHNGNVQQESLHNGNAQQESLHNGNAQQGSLHNINAQQGSLRNANAQQDSVYNTNAQQGSLHNANGQQESLHNANGQLESLHNANSQQGSPHTINAQ